MDSADNIPTPTSEETLLQQPSHVLPIDFNIQIPAYFPLHLDLLNDFERIGRSQYNFNIDSTLKESINNIINQTEEYLAFSLDETSLTTTDVDAGFLVSNLSTLEQLLKSQHELDIWKRSTDESKAKIRSKRRHETELHFLNLEEYSTRTDLPIGVLVNDEYADYKYIHNQETSFQTILKMDDSYQYLKNVAFILENPETPLPDEVQDDDLEVAGGKISLRDPMSLNYFQIPVVSKKCSHVYEKDTIYNYLIHNKKCPVDGCDASLTRNDLKPDKIMTLRVKAYLIKEKTKKDLRNVERL